VTATTARTGRPERAAVARLGDARSAVAALGVAGALGSLTAAAVVTAAGAWGLPGAEQLPVDLAVGIAYPLTGAAVVIASRGERGTATLGWMLLLSGVAAAITSAGIAAALVASGPTTTALAAVHVQGWLWVPGFLPLLTLLPLLYPEGLLPGGIWRAAGAAGLLGTLLFALGVSLYPTAFTGRTTLTKPWTAQGPAEALTAAGALLLVPALIAGLASLLVRLRRSTGLRRRQVVVLLLAAVVLVAVTAVQGVLPQPAGVLAQAVAVGLVPVAIGVAVTRHRLYDLDLALCRGLVALSLAGCLAGAYVTLFSLLQALGQGRTALSGALAAGVTGVLVQPLATRLTRGVDRLFYGHRADPYAVTSRLSAELSEGVDVGDVPGVVCRSVVESLRLPFAQVLLDVDGTGHPVAEVGVPEGTPRHFGMRHRGEVVGWLVVTPRPGERGIDDRDAELLATLADQAAPAVAALHLHERLQQSREALVVAREEERRRLRRDLHDGLGAALAGVRLQLESARDLVDDPVAGHLLDAAGAGVEQAVADVRSVTDDLLPPALDDLGLAGALAAVADRLRTPDLDVTVETGDLPSLPAAVEVACYRITAEALANAVRHAGAVTVRVRVTAREGRLVLEVCDDGSGLRPATGRRGLGLESMRRRAEEIGGAFTLDTGRDGTTVRAVLPLGRTT
jgi:two-component system NarL family sensor kinase